MLVAFYKSVMQKFLILIESISDELVAPKTDD